MKKKLYSFITYSFSIAIILGIAFNVAGIILVWGFVPTVSDQLLKTATFVQKTLNSTENLLEITDSAFGKAQDNIGIIAEATGNMADSMDKTSDITTSISGIMSEEFSAIVDNTQKALTSLESSAKLVDDTLSFVASIPIIGSNYSNKTPLHSSVVEINESITKLPKNITDLQDNLDKASSTFTTLNENLINLSNSVEEIEANLSDAREVINSYQELVNEAQDKTERAIEIIPSRVRWTAVGITILFLWVILVQAGLILYIRDMAALQQKLQHIVIEDNAKENRSSANTPQ